MSQFQRYMEDYQEEDHKLEILNYILVMFLRENSTTVDLKRKLLYPLRFAIEFNEVLNGDVKNIIN